MYKGSSWCIPESFMFPHAISRLNGWRRWLLGAVHVVGSKAWRIKPYRKFTGHDIHSTRLKNQHKLTWKPIFTTMMLAPGVSIPSNQEDIDEAFVKSSYAIATEHLKSRFSYIFSDPMQVLLQTIPLALGLRKYNVPKS